MGRMRTLVGICALAGLIAASCGDSDDDSGADSGSPSASAAATTEASADAPDESAPADTEADSSDSGDSAASGGGSGAGGVVVLGDETITLDRARCFLQEQDAAAGGGKILFVAQGFGTNAAGDEVVLDVSRYDEDSQFTGDDVKLDIGDPFSDDFVSWSSVSDIGTVSLDGSSLSANGLTFSNFDDGAEAAGSFDLTC